jgi:hypothetical protein
MDPHPTAPPPVRFNRLLPYWAVLQTDARQTLASWPYRLWVIVTLLGAGGSVAYKAGVHQQAGIAQSASERASDLARGLGAAGLALVALLAVSAVGGERGTVADAVLSRGISRRQYFLAKWHARLAVVLATYAVLAAGVLGANQWLLKGDLTLAGAGVGILLVGAALTVVVTWGVTIGALANGTVLGITVFWLLIYGGLLAGSFLPESYPSPERVLDSLRAVLRGLYDPDAVTRVLGLAAGLSGGAAVVGLVGFGRKDV